MTPGRSIGRAGLIARPWAGMWPPKPGSRMIAAAVITPAIAQTGSGHHSGALSYPSCSGSLSKTPTCV